MKFWRRKRKTNTYSVWGIRAPNIVRDRWIALSRIIGVPCNRLILFILKDWSIRNKDILLSGERRKKLASFITEEYLAGRLE